MGFREAGQLGRRALHRFGAVPEYVDGRRGQPQRAVALGHRHDAEPGLGQPDGRDQASHPGPEHYDVGHRRAR